jgi:hypothetical protein
MGVIIDRSGIRMVIVTVSVVPEWEAKTAVETEP